MSNVRTHNYLFSLGGLEDCEVEVRFKVYLTGPVSKEAAVQLAKGFLRDPISPNLNSFQWGDLKIQVNPDNLTSDNIIAIDDVPCIPIQT